MWVIIVPNTSTVRGDRQAQMTMGIEKDPIELADFFKSGLNFIKNQLLLQYTYRSPLGINQVVQTRTVI